jgi:hypothetical protein
MATPSPQTRRQIDVDLLHKIEDLAFNAGRRPAQIEAALRGDRSLTGRVPSRRTIQRVVRDLAYTDESEPWRLDATLSPEDAQWLIQAAAHVTIHSRAARALTVAEGEWVLAVGHAAPSLPVGTALAIAREYLRRAEKRQPTGDLDVYLAAAPWAHKRTRKRYLEVASAAGLDLLTFETEEER